MRSPSDHDVSGSGYKFEWIADIAFVLTMFTIVFRRSTWRSHGRLLYFSREPWAQIQAWPRGRHGNARTSKSAAIPVVTGALIDNDGSGAGQVDVGSSVGRPSAILLPGPPCTATTALRFGARHPASRDDGLAHVTNGQWPETPRIGKRVLSVPYRVHTLFAVRALGKEEPRDPMT